MSEQKITTKEVLSVIAVSGIVVSSLIFPSLPMAISEVYKQWNTGKLKSFLIEITADIFAAITELPTRYQGSALDAKK